MTRLALAAVLAVPFLLCGCAEDPIPKLSDELEELDLNRRLVAVAQLRDLDDDRAIDLLAEALESDEELARAAGEALADKGRRLRTEDKPDKVNEALTRIMTNTHLESAPRAMAAWALGEIGDRESVPALKSARSANDAKGVAAKDVRDHAKYALEKLGYYTKGRELGMDAERKVSDESLDVTPGLEPPSGLEALQVGAEPSEEAAGEEAEPEGTKEGGAEAGATPAADKPGGT